MRWYAHEAKSLAKGGGRLAWREFAAEPQSV